jgi:hypothetical protein
MWQQALIGFLVLAAVVYVGWTFASMRLRQRLLDSLAVHGILGTYAQRHRARLSAPGCSNCSAADHSEIARSQKR